MRFKLNVSTNQEAFDKVAEHLASMPSRAVNPVTEFCEYRTVDGNRCAIGALIDDDAVGDARCGVRMMVSDGDLDICGVDIQLLRELQGVHDRRDNWVDDKFVAWEYLPRIAVRYGLRCTL